MVTGTRIAAPCRQGGAKTNATEGGRAPRKDTMPQKGGRVVSTCVARAAAAMQGHHARGRVHVCLLLSSVAAMLRTRGRHTTGVASNRQTLTLPLTSGPRWGRRTALTLTPTLPQP